MSTVRTLLELKEKRVGKREPISVSSKDMVIDAQRKMRGNKVGSVLVKDGEACVGILTERDCNEKLELEHRLAVWTRAEEIMTPSPLDHVILNSTYEEVAARFEGEGKHKRHLIVEDGGKIIDVISQRDLIYALLAHNWSLEDERHGAMMHRT